MSLTAGATLQNGKYLIQAMLHQSDATVSYQATHTSLNQPVVIHTLNASLQQSPRFDLLRQQFLATVKQDGIEAAIVRDCFEEDKLPYAVLEPTPTPINLSDSMPFLTPAVLSASTSGGTATAATETIAPPQTLPAGEATPVQLPVLPHAAPPAPTQHPTSTPQHSTSLTPAPLATRHPSKRRWLPLALLLTACGAGLAGGAIGWKLRYSAATPTAPALFSREQAFPEKTDWLGEDPYADDSGTEDDFDSASPAIERRSLTPRRSRAIEPEREYEPRPRSRRVDRPSVARPERVPEAEPQPQIEEKPAIEAPPKIEVLPDPAPPIEAPPPALDPVIPEPPPAPAEIPSPKTQLAPIAPPAEPISQ